MMRSGPLPMPRVSRQRVVTEARTWLGTPFHHQAALKGVGCDCAGLIRGVGEVSGAIKIDPAEWAAVGNYGRQPHPPRMRAVLEHFLIPVEGPKIADVCWMEWREGLPMHLAILAEHQGRQTIIHALTDAGKVVEHGLTDEWRARITSWWRYPGLA